MAESLHYGHAVICDDSGQIVEAWGDPDAVVYPRSSSKMLQALPLITSGAADAHGLTEAQLALACASHEGAPLHVNAVEAWLKDLGLAEPDLRCGVQPTRDKELRRQMVKTDDSPCQLHNNCSGKHAGFLTLSKHLGAGPEYVEVDHPVQLACKDAFEEITGQDSPFYGIDGCSAPNHATTMHAMARAMARFASAQDRSDLQSQAAARLTQAMIAYPMNVAGEGRACTELMQAASEPVALKTGAEGYFVAILPKRKLGIAVKAADGATRAAECAIAALLVRLGALDANHPATLKRMNAPETNWRGIETGAIRPAPGLL
jgi:L-asparaginase II